MKLLALDISSKTGYALVQGEVGIKPELLSAGTIWMDRSVKDHGLYPWSFKLAAEKMVGYIREQVREADPSTIVIEETNLGRNRYSQKYLEFTHAYVLKMLGEEFPAVKVVYLDTSAWRKAIGLWLSKEDRKTNAKLSRAKSAAKHNQEPLDKKALGIKGKKTWKHLSVQRVNDTYGLSLKQKDNDQADAICLCLAFFNNAEPCNGE